ncbi:hypothetical protein [Amycolatopsis sp. NPDC057786]|uniref:hypothetical protein n=1 Tax=Amycolatopsis sp. NPDC057786 TaxID=3346250 RepID=UPI0036719233
MRRREVIKKIAVAARRQRAAWILEREGANHTIYTLNGVVVPIPRHTELGEIFAVDIFKECEGVLGKGWWRK